MNNLAFEKTFVNLNKILKTTARKGIILPKMSWSFGVNKEIYNDLKYIRETKISNETERELRDRLQRLLMFVHRAEHFGTIAPAELVGVTDECYRKLRRLRNFSSSEKTAAAPELCNLRELVDSICCACDLSLSILGKRVFLIEGGGQILARCNAQDVTEIIVNLISNSCLYSESNDIFVSAGAAGQRVVIEVFSSGKMNIPAVRKSIQQKGSGLNACAALAHSNGGTVFFCSKNSFAMSVLALDSCRSGRPVSSVDFVELLCDRLSPVYVGLSSVIAPEQQI